MNRVAFITGAGGYIGGETAKVLAAEGVSVAVCDLIPERVEQTVADILAAGGSAKGYVADVTDSAAITAAIEQAAVDSGRLDILVHAAGGSSRIAGPEAKYVHLVDQEDWVIDRVLKVNLYGAFYADRAAARIMIRQGQGGKIINFGSAVGINGLCCCADYAAAKGGIMSLTKTLAKELGPHKINVICVAPGVVARPDEEHDDTYKYNTNFLNERCTGTDIADLIAFLVSDKNRFITGQTYVVDGGRSLAMRGSE